MENTLDYQEIYHLTKQQWGNHHPKNHCSNRLLAPTAQDAYLFRKQASEILVILQRELAIGNTSQFHRQKLIEYMTI
jgi:hypothetical protein